MAAERAPEIAWLQGDAESLPFRDGSFDAVISQFGVMLFSDRQKALSEMLRVLVPGGRLAVAVWDAVARIPAYAAAVALLPKLQIERILRESEDVLAPFASPDGTVRFETSAHIVSVAN